MEQKHRNNPFNYERAWSPLASLARQQDPSSPEQSGAIYEVCDAMLFIFAPQASVYDEKGRIVLEESIRDMERGHAYVASLAPWVEEVRTRATAEQRQYLKDAGLDGVQDEEKDSAGSTGHDEASGGPESEPGHAASLRPDPIQAVSILQSLAQRYDRSTVAHTALELAVQTLRFILDSGQADTFRSYLEALEKPVPPEKLARFGVTAP